MHPLSKFSATLLQFNPMLSFDCPSCRANFNYPAAANTLQSLLSASDTMHLDVEAHTHACKRACPCGVNLHDASASPQAITARYVKNSSPLSF